MYKRLRSGRVVPFTEVPAHSSRSQRRSLSTFPAHPPPSPSLDKPDDDPFLATLTSFSTTPPSPQTRKHHTRRTPFTFCDLPLECIAVAFSFFNTTFKVTEVSRVCKLFYRILQKRISWEGLEVICPTSMETALCALTRSYPGLCVRNTPLHFGYLVGKSRPKEDRMSSRVLRELSRINIGCLVMSNLFWGACNSPALSSNSFSGLRALGLISVYAPYVLSLSCAPCLETLLVRSCVGFTTLRLNGLRMLHKITLEDCIFSSLCGMDDLVSLSEVSAKECAVSQIEDWSKEMPQLRTLCMSRSVHFGQEMMRHSELLPVLERMTYCMPMGAEEAAALQKLPCLTSLGLAQLETPGDAVLSVVAHIPGLTEFRLFQPDQISDSSISALANTRSITKFVCGGSPSVAAACVKLLSHAECIQFLGIISLGKLVSLSGLHLFRNLQAFTFVDCVWDDDTDQCSACTWLSETNAQLIAALPAITELSVHPPATEGGMRALATIKPLQFLTFEVCKQRVAPWKSAWLRHLRALENLQYLALAPFDDGADNNSNSSSVRVSEYDESDGHMHDIADCCSSAPLQSTSDCQLERTNEDWASILAQFPKLERICVAFQVPERQMHVLATNASMVSVEHIVNGEVFVVDMSASRCS